jgi:general secretion pathway protein J
MSVLPAKRHSEAGFTLLELMVAVSLLALLSVMMVGGLSFGARVWEHSESTGQDQSHIAAVQALLRRQIAEMQAQQVRGADRRPSLAFEGTGERLAFIGPVPEYLGRGGYYVIAVELEASGREKNLVMRWEPFTRERPGLAFSEAARQEVLLRDVASVAFRYFGRDRRGQPDGWLATWAAGDRLPQLVALELSFAPEVEAVWPKLVAAVVTEGGER